MPLRFDWLGFDQAERVASVRNRCYGGRESELAHFLGLLLRDRRAADGDFLVASDAGRDVGTATSLRLRMWVRGTAVPCQGVAWVGAVKSARRRGGDDAGVASQVMQQMLAAARDRGEVLSALMPFRASFYEHFGYGLVERRFEWTVPLGILPPFTSRGARFYEDADLDAVAGLYQREVEAGQCDIERSRRDWTETSRFESGFRIVLEAPNGALEGYAFFEPRSEAGRDGIRCVESACASPEARVRLLAYFGTLRDQYAFLRITLPADLPLNLLLRESQLAHRPVNHPVAAAAIQTRTQVRVLDHCRLLESMRLAIRPPGEATVEIHETEGHKSRIHICLEDGHAEGLRSERSAGFTCSDRTWASVVCGELSATRALRLGLAEGEPRTAEVLDAFAEGPLPFLRESF